MGTVEETNCIRYADGTPSEEQTSVAVESPLTIFVNGTELVTTMCTPVKVNFLAVGYLFNEGIISGMKDIALLRVCDEETEVEVRLVRQDFAPASPRLVTSGCGGGSGQVGTTGLKVESDARLKPDEIGMLMKRLLDAADTHRAFGGLHTSALGDGAGLAVVAEDIGRHNTIDRIAGECLVKRIPTAGRALVSTGRMSSEMLVKAARMGVPFVISRGALTSRAIAFARDLGITAIGYARGDKFTVYSHPERIG